MEQIHLIDPLAAGKEDRRQLVRLWEECFEADEPYLQVYREQMLVKSDARTVVLREQGKILGMLTLRPAPIGWEGGSCRRCICLPSGPCPRHRASRWRPVCFRGWTAFCRSRG